MSSNLEKLIRKCKRVWKKNEYDPALIDKMIDNMVSPFDIESLSNASENDIIKATEKFLERIKQNEEWEKRWNKKEKGEKE